MSSLKPKRTYKSGQKPRTTGKQNDLSFADIVKDLTPGNKKRGGGSEPASAPLASLDYPTELALKEKALLRFWEQHNLPGRPQALIGSPKPRGYRTTSKRKAVLRGSTLYLHFGDRFSKKQKATFQPSSLEPAEHTVIYRFLQGKLSEATYRLVAAHLNYLIIRGSYSERTIIFNIDEINGPLVRKLKMLSKHLQNLPDPVNSAFIYPDPSRSSYYLESRRPSDSLKLKKLFGPNQLALNFDNHSYLYHPTSFSQVNESMVPLMLEQARNLLAPPGNSRLLDLYCGYGLFSHFLAPDYKEIIGLDAEGPSIRAAAANSRRFKTGGRRRFLAHRITGEVLEDTLPPPTAQESIILDPPRQGPLSGVISTLCRRSPKTVLHIFCSVDQIPNSISEWRKNGYQISKIVPLDMFPGSANLEVAILINKKSQ